MATYVVSALYGNDNRPGTQADPLRTIDEANERVTPGDTVWVAKGVYAPFAARTDGVTYVTSPTNRAVIDANRAEDFGILIRADNVSIRGFEVRESSDSGIIAKDVHHVAIDKVYSHHNGRHGIYVSNSDFVAITNNEVAYNVSTKPNAGISIAHPKDHGVAGSESPLWVENNFVHHNRMIGDSRHTDGFGIIWDNNPERAYGHSIMFKDNIAAWNGHEGFLLFNADKAFMIGNVAYHNGQDRTIVPDYLGEFEVRDSSVYAARNVFVSDDPRQKTIILMGWERGHDFTWIDNQTYVEGHPGLSGVLDRGAPHEMPPPSLNDLGVPWHGGIWDLWG